MNKRIKKKLEKKHTHQRIQKLTKMENPNMIDVLKAVYGRPIPFGWNHEHMKLFPSIIDEERFYKSGETFGQSIFLNIRRNIE